MGRKGMKISCLAITEDRPEFMPWLVWNYAKQDWPDKKLIVVDTSESLESADLLLENPYFKEFPDEILLNRTLPHKSLVATKRNYAMDLVEGDVITWFDDDDWSWSCRLSYMMGEYMKDDKLLAVFLKCFLPYINLKTLKFRSLKCNVWAYSICELQAARTMQFREDTRRGRGSDTTWLGQFRASIPQDRQKEVRISGVAMAVSHRKNISNPVGKISNHMWKHDLKKPEIVAEDEWELTLKHLKELQGRVYNDR
jgi:hypothetical protein